MELTGKTREIRVLDRPLTFFNQRCRDWTHPYPYHNDETLSSAGCGIFSLCHAAAWLTGETQSPEAWADFSVRAGGRGDDGTDRPALLHALQATGEAARLGFRYEEDGLRNDLEALWTHLAEGRGVAFCNLRVGHIVCLVAARERAGRRELLAIDSYSESADQRVRDHVREVLPGSEILWPVRSAAGDTVGFTLSYGAFWVDADLPRDFNLLHRLG